MISTLYESIQNQDAPPAASSSSPSPQHSPPFQALWSVPSGDGVIVLDAEGRAVVAHRTLTCPLCTMVGIPHCVHNETTMVRSHLREMHSGFVAPGNARMGRPGATTAGAGTLVQGQEKRRVRRLSSMCQDRNGARVRDMVSGSQECA
ncbi:uncharacterized protein V1513DRAFT_427892 [Lipomyces chichibuensis]|uniref:uncharacterized protein n=1 Tax=Lipomyces chichibuensis TaxID=1546026 RepID=UPI003343DE72